MKKRKLFQKETVQWNFYNRGNCDLDLDLDGSTNTLSDTNVYIFLNLKLTFFWLKQLFVKLNFKVAGITFVFISIHNFGPLSFGNRTFIKKVDPLMPFR